MGTTTKSTGRLVRSENEARTIEKALFCSLKVLTLKKFVPTLGTAKLLSSILAVLRVAQRGFYTSNFFHFFKIFFLY